MHCKAWVSPLQRCTQLAHALSDLRPDLKPQTDMRLREMDFGKWEGVAWDAIPMAEVKAWTDDFGEYRFGGVESANQVLVRVSALWDEARQHPDETQIWITHAGVARAISLLSKGSRKVTKANQWPKDAPEYGEWWKIDL
jgi:alpha-ribazole phosphatase